MKRPTFTQGDIGGALPSRVGLERHRIKPLHFCRMQRVILREPWGFKLGEGKWPWLAKKLWGCLARLHALKPWEAQVEHFEYTDADRGKVEQTVSVAVREFVRRGGKFEDAIVIIGERDFSELTDTPPYHGTRVLDTRVSRDGRLHGVRFICAAHTEGVAVIDRRFLDV